MIFRSHGEKNPDERFSARFPPSPSSLSLFLSPSKRGQKKEKVMEKEKV
jgi:hypothetical protein